jgi:hypothetical protein
MIPKGGRRFSEKIMFKQNKWTMIRFNLIGSWSSGANFGGVEPLVHRAVLRRSSEVTDCGHDPDAGTAARLVRLVAFVAA